MQSQKAMWIIKSGLDNEEVVYDYMVVFSDSSPDIDEETSFAFGPFEIPDSPANSVPSLDRLRMEMSLMLCKIRASKKMKPKDYGAFEIRLKIEEHPGGIFEVAGSIYKKRFYGGNATSRDGALLSAFVHMETTIMAYDLYKS